MSLKVGELVAFPSFGGQKLSIQGEDFLIYKEQDIFAVLED
jgi:co-chaperonin GroES (HSP10)